MDIGTLLYVWRECKLTAVCTTNLNNFKNSLCSFLQALSSLLFRASSTVTNEQQRNQKGERIKGCINVCNNTEGPKIEVVWYWRYVILTVLFPTLLVFFSSFFLYRDSWAHVHVTNPSFTRLVSSTFLPVYKLFCTFFHYVTFHSEKRKNSDNLQVSF